MAICKEAKKDRLLVKGSISVAVPPIFTSDVAGRYNKINGINFGVTVVCINISIYYR